MDNITRQDLATIFVRYMNFFDSDVSVTDKWIEFADAANISDYAMDAIQTLNKLDIIRGIGKNAAGLAIIDPKGFATRAQAAAILERFLAAMK